MIAVEGLTLTQGDFHLRSVALTVPRGCYAVLMGQTGSGKTTLLEAIAGLRAVRAGQIVVGGRDVTHLPPAARDVGYVPQDGALFRTMTVADNLAFGLMLRRVSVKQIAARVKQLARWLRVEHLLMRRAIGLSGGETQRIALGRALAYGPPVLLMDEPLSSLDEETREHLVGLLRGIRRRGAVTVLHVSHSRYEADQLGDLVLRLHEGRIEVERAPPAALLVPADAAFHTANE